VSDAKCYTVYVQRSQPPETIDIGKQLLTLIGTLMTAVTSFYFGSRTVAAQLQDKGDTVPNDPKANDSVGRQSSGAGPSKSALSANDGCALELHETEATKDEHLPPAKGGIA
jgi:hypothetical protein